MGLEAIKRQKLVPLQEYKQVSQSENLVTRRELGGIGVGLAMGLGALGLGGVAGGFVEAKTGFGLGVKYTEADLTTAKDLARQGYTLNADVATQIANAKKDLPTSDQAKAQADKAVADAHDSVYNQGYAKGKTDATCGAAGIESGHYTSEVFPPGEEGQKMAAKRWGIEGTPTADWTRWTIIKDENNQAATFNKPDSNGIVHLQGHYQIRIGPNDVADGFLDQVHNRGTGNTRVGIVATTNKQEGVLIPVQGVTMRAVTDKNDNGGARNTLAKEVYTKKGANEHSDSTQKGVIVIRICDSE